MNDPRATFFPQRKIRMFLAGWAPKMNREAEKRIRLDFEIPLLDDARDGMIPGWIINALNALEDKESKESGCTFDLTLEGVTLELFETPKSPGRILLLTASTLDGFSLQRKTRDSKTYLALCFNTNVKRDSITLKWADKYEACYVWSEFTPTAPDIPSKPIEGAQMTIGDVPQATEGLTVEQSQNNIGDFFKKHDGEAEQPEVDEDEAEETAPEDPEEVTDAPTPVLHGEMPVQDEVRKAAVESIDKPAVRRPKGFNKPTNASVN